MNQDQAKRYAQHMVSFGRIEDYDVETLVEILKHADDLYYNSDGSFLTDADYDAIRLYAYQQEPDHSYFTGIGSQVRGGKVALPVPLGSLNQIEYDEVEKWVKDHSVYSKKIIITEKLDGISLLLVYDKNGHLQNGFTRGDGTNGTDISHHIRHIPSIPKHVQDISLVRGELIIPKHNWSYVKCTVTTKSGTPYKNARNCIAGLINSAHIDSRVYPLIDFVAYDILD